MAEAAGAAAELLRTLANPHRLMIVCRLVEGEHSVGELASALELRDSTVSQHLAVLRRERLVRARRDAQTIWYSLASKPARAVLETLFRLYCAPPPVTARNRANRAPDLTQVKERRPRPS
ncbi:MAG TPA: metalloregulator ArsR/SmtB family transcription factor [Acetobacteraceae bacterium]|nr:metalloregulator ArsR/SmtB family transcription factor [Acetobacteraceae bacterium]